MIGFEIQKLSWSKLQKGHLGGFGERFGSGKAVHRIPESLALFGLRVQSISTGGKNVLGQVGKLW